MLPGTWHHGNTMATPKQWLSNNTGDHAWILGGRWPLITFEQQESVELSTVLFCFINSHQQQSIRPLILTSLFCAKLCSLCHKCLDDIIPSLTPPLEHLTPSSWGYKWMQNNTQTAPKRLSLNDFLSHYKSHSTSAFAHPTPPHSTPPKNYNNNELIFTPGVFFCSKHSSTYLSWQTY